MASINGRVYVPAPNTDAGLRYGLFKVVPPQSMTDDHIQMGGVQYLVSDCTPDRPLTVVCGPTAAMTFDAGPTTVTADPFVVYASMTCGLVGYTQAEYEAWLRHRLEVGEQGAVELAFSNQANGEAPGLANNGSAVTLTAVTTVTAALSSLEQWLYQTVGYGKPGIIHAPVVAASYFREDNSIKRDDNGVFRTPAGTAISFGNYSGNLPNGSAPAAGHTTFYITGQMAIWRSDVFVPPLDRTFGKDTNQYNAVAERGYVVAIDCNVAGVDVTLAP